MTTEFQWPPGDSHFGQFGSWRNYQQKSRGRALHWSRISYQERDEPPYMGISLGLALDIGAHAGSWSFELAEHFAWVIAFEPLHWFTWEQNKSSLGVMNAEVRPWALGRDRGWYNINQQTEGNTGDCAMQITRDPWLPRVPQQCGDDQYWGPWGIDLIKIDVQGQELAVLQGLTQTIHEHQPCICVEFNQGNAFGELWLQSQGYTLCEQIGKDWIWRRQINR